MYQGSLEPVSNRADWVETIKIADAAGGIPAVTAAKVRVKGDCVDIQKTLGSGVAYDDVTGTFVFTIPDTDLRNARPGEYAVGILVTVNGVEVQLFAGTVSVIDGVVS